MRSAAFEYHRPDSLDAALAMLAEFGDEGRPLAGGQSLVPMMNLRLARPEHLVDINDLHLDTIGRDGDVLRIGGLLRHQRYLSEPLIRDHCPVFAEGVHSIGHPTIRRNGTTGGSLAHADPTAELPLLCLLHDARIVAASTAGRRSIASDAFLDDAYTTALVAGEMIVEIEVPVPAGRSTGAFLEFGERRGDFAMAATGVTIEFEDHRILSARIACSGGAMRALRAPELEKALTNQPLDGSAPVEAIDAFTASLEPPDDHTATAGYRRALIGTLLERSISTACKRAIALS